MEFKEIVRKIVTEGEYFDTGFRGPGFGVGQMTQLWNLDDCCFALYYDRESNQENIKTIEDHVAHVIFVEIYDKNRDYEEE